MRSAPRAQLACVGVDPTISLVAASNMQTAGHRRLCVDRRLRVLRTALVGMGEGAHSGDYTDSDDHASVIPIAWALHGPFRLRLMLTSARQHVPKTLRAMIHLRSSDQF